MRTATKSVPARSIDEYLDALPEKVRTTLEKLRKTIKSIVPKAEEVISYQVPSFKYNGMLVGFAAFKDHCSFFVMSTSLMKAFKEKLRAYDTAKATIHFAADKPLPDALVKMLVKARIEENEARLIARTNRKRATKKRP